MSPRNHGYGTVPDVKNEESPLVNGHRRRRCHVCPALGFVLIAAAVLGLIVRVVFKPAPDLQPQIEAAQAAVQVTEEGEYKVVIDKSQVTSSTTFAQLAQQMLPPWYEASLLAINTVLTEDMKPGSVSYARKVLLMNRNVLDAFSPVFSPLSLWGQVRKQFDAGYEAVGNFQDLDHSGVSYTDVVLQNRQQEVLDWKKHFLRFTGGHNVRKFIYLSANPTQCVRHDSSHLFWADLVTLPCGHDPATSSLRNLGQVQLKTADAYWETIQQYNSVLEEEQEEEFHNLRKELRIFLDEFDLFGDILLPDPNQEYLDILANAQDKLGDLNDKWTAYNIYATHDSHHKKQQKLIDKIKESWEDFQTWAQGVALGDVIQSVLSHLEQE